VVALELLVEMQTQILAAMVELVFLLQLLVLP
jgi:hypothetical protein